MLLFQGAGCTLSQLHLQLLVGIHISIWKTSVWVLILCCPPSDHADTLISRLWCRTRLKLRWRQHVHDLKMDLHGREAHLLAALHNYFNQACVQTAPGLMHGISGIKLMLQKADKQRSELMKSGIMICEL